MKPIGMLAASLGAASGLLAGCAGPLDRPTVRLDDQVTRVEDAIEREWRRNVTSQEDGATTPGMDELVALPVLDADSDLDDFLVYAALNNPALEAAFARWKGSCRNGGSTDWSRPFATVAAWSACERSPTAAKAPTN